MSMEETDARITELLQEIRETEARLEGLRARLVRLLRGEVNDGCDSSEEPRADL